MRIFGNKPTLADWAQGRRNNFDLLRLCGALLVIYAHQFSIVGGQTPLVPVVKASHYGTFGVWIFFVISGFLITQSYLRSGSPIRFIVARVLRIFPALLVVTLTLVFVAGPLLSTLSVGEYFRHPWTLEYLRGALSLYEVTRFTVLPGVFMENPIVQTNGPLWTLQYEWSFYLLILVFGTTGILRSGGALLILLLFSIGATDLGLAQDLNFYWTPVFYIPQFFLFFGVGALASVFRSFIPMRWEWALAMAGVLLFSLLFGPLSLTVFFLPFGYLVLYLGLNPRFDLSVLTRTGDYSYGLYIWGWPVQQFFVVVLGKDCNVYLLLACSIAVASLLAVLSWHLVEKRALACKQWMVAGRAQRAGT